MLYLVKKDFTDKRTGEDHAAGDVIDITEERASEILATCELILPLDEIIAANASALNAAKEAAAIEAEEPEETEKKASKPAARRTKKAGDAK